MLTVLIPNTITFHGQMPPGTRAVTYDVHSPIPPQHRDAQVVVVWANPPQRLAALPTELPKVEFVQGLMAGTEMVLQAFPAHIPVASGRGLHDHPVAEHTLALLLAAMRSLPDLVRAHDRHEWRSDLGGVKQVALPGIRTLTNARVTLWGFGSIATAIAPLLTALGAQVRGLATSAGQRQGYRVDAVSDRLEVLENTDILIMVLPDEPATAKILSTNELAQLPKHAIVINVGRGATVDEPALITALQQGEIAYALLDVVGNEPLPADDPLWDAPNLLITPHAAGGRPVGFSDLIVANTAAWLAGQPVQNRVR